MKLYDDGYQNCPCFWGKKPAKLVVTAVEMLSNQSQRNRLKSVDFGCGEGKNISYVSKFNFNTLGIDQSTYAIQNAVNNNFDSDCIFLVSDMQQFVVPANTIDLVISTGSVHCLESEEQVISMLNVLKTCCRTNGLIVFSVFNNRYNDFSGHGKNFNPILLSHGFYVKQFSETEILHESDTDLFDKHPNNEIEHFHSITRILAKKR